MLDAPVHTLMNFIAAHAMWALPVVFLITFGESLVFIAFVCPGTTVLLACGALIGGHALPAWPVVVGGLSGAILGDAVSYWLGWRYGHLTETVWPFTAHPEMLSRGYDFFSRHGLIGIFIGRFLGPFRAVLPLLAGITRMSAGKFWFANIGSALIWVPALLIPGSIAGYLLEILGERGKWNAAIAVVVVVALGIAGWLARRAGYLGGAKPASAAAPAPLPDKAGPLPPPAGQDRHDH